MFNAASKTSFTVAGVALVAAIAAIVAVPDRVGFSALMWIAVAATAVGLASFAFTPRDPVVPLSPEVEAATARTVDVSDLPTGSPWPLVGAAAVVLLGVGAALGSSLIVMGLIAAAIATFAWLAQVWREHPSWTVEMSDRLNDRFIVPIGLPATVVVFAGIAVVSISRVFLTVSASAAPIVAGVVAFIMLGLFQLISSREQVGRSVLTALVAVSSLLVVGVGVASALRGERDFAHHGGDEHAALVVKALDIEFEAKTLQLPAAIDFELELENEGELPHNLSIYEDEGGAEIFKGEIIDGGETITYAFKTPDAGTYYFQCDVHPQEMKGTVEVAAEDVATTTTVAES